MRLIGNIAWLLGMLVVYGCSEEPETFDELLAAGEKAYINQEYKKARDYLGRAFQKNASNRHVLYFLAMSYARDMKYDSAYSLLRRADIRFPNDREINKELYRMAVALEEWTHAIKAARVLIATGDPPSMYYRDLAEIHAMKEQYGNAYRYLRKELEQSPSDSEIYLELADLARLANMGELAVAILDTAIQKFGPKPAFRRARATSLTRAGQYAEAEAAFRELISELGPDPRLRLSLATALIPQKSREKRMEAYRIMMGLKDSVQTKPKFDSLLSELQDSLQIEDREG